MISLDASFSSNLDWKVEQGEVFYLDFGWQNFNPFDSALLNAYFLAVEQFCKKFPHAKKVIFAKIQKSFSSFIQVPKNDSDFFSHELICAQAFSDYLHRLASILPDAMEPIISIELKENLFFAENILLFSMRRFEHFQLDFTKKSIPVRKKASILVSIPQDEKYFPEEFNNLFSQLSTLSYTCIPEELLNEHWNEVNYLIIDPASLGEIGLRMLYGFEAAGGIIISTRGPLGFANETSLEIFLRSRGI